MAGRGERLGADRHRHRLGRAGRRAGPDRGGVQHAARRSADLSTLVNARDPDPAGGLPGSGYKPGKPAGGRLAGDLVSLQAVQQRESLSPAARGAGGDRPGRGADEPLPRHGQRRDDRRAERTARGAIRTGWPSAPARWRCSTTCSATCEAGDEVVYAWRSFEAYPIAVQITGATGGAGAAGTRCGARPGRRCWRRSPRPPWPSCCARRTTRPGRRCGTTTWSRSVDAVPEDVAGGAGRGVRGVRRRPAAVARAGADADRPNVVVLRTFSKAYGLAGFRVGYCVAPPGAGGGRPGGGAALRGLGRRPRPRRSPRWPPSRPCWSGSASWSCAGTAMLTGSATSASRCRTPRATSSGCPRRTAHR